MRLVLVGPPGAGKGTQAQFIASHLSIPKISTGDIFRSNVSQGTALGRRAQAFMERGDLVPDEVTIAMVTDRLQEDDAQSGYLLDGFPRNVPQAETLKKLLSAWDARLDVVLELVVDDDEVVRRLSGRRTCRRCGRIWHVLFDPPAHREICDDCGGELFQRDDDREETIRHRIEVYQEQTAPLVAFYADEGILLGIDATGPVEEITERALSALRRFIRLPRAAGTVEAAVAEREMRMPSDPKLRCSDADRERTVALLREHLAAGRLTAEEFNERLEAAFAARTQGQLDELLADLPAIDLYELPDATVRRSWPGYGQLPWGRRSG